MTPAETLQAAADRLTALDKAATPGPWCAMAHHVAQDVQSCTCDGGVGWLPHEPHCGWEPVGGPFGVTPEGECTDPELIVALRPLAPLLAEILTDLARYAAKCPDIYETTVSGGRWLAVARAILGGAA